MKAEVRRTWSHHRSHDKVKGSIIGMKGLEVTKPLDIVFEQAPV
jgi:hypothetical protein